MNTHLAVLSVGREYFATSPLQGLERVFSSKLPPSENRKASPSPRTATRPLSSGVKKTRAGNGPCVPFLTALLAVSINVTELLPIDDRQGSMIE